MGNLTLVKGIKSDTFKLKKGGNVPKNTNSVLRRAEEWL
jgi:hypothetical protein